MTQQEYYTRLLHYILLTGGVSALAVLFLAVFVGLYFWIKLRA